MTTSIPNYRSYRLTEENFNRYKAMIRNGVSSWRLSQEQGVPISTANRIFRAKDFKDYEVLLAEARNKRYESQQKQKQRQVYNAHPVQVSRADSPFADQSKRVYTEVATSTIAPDIKIDGKLANKPTPLQAAARTAISNWASEIHATDKKGSPVVLKPANPSAPVDPKETVGLRYIKKEICCTSALIPGQGDPRLTDDCPYVPFWPLPVNGGRPLHLYQDGSTISKRYTYQEVQAIIKDVRENKVGVNQVLRNHRTCGKQIFRQILFITNPYWLKEFDEALEYVNATPRRTTDRINEYVKKANAATLAKRNPEKLEKATVDAQIDNSGTADAAGTELAEKIKDVAVTTETTGADLAESGVEKGILTVKLAEGETAPKPRERSRWPVRINWAFVGAQLVMLAQQFITHSIDCPWYVLLLPLWGLLAAQIAFDIFLSWRVLWWAVNGRDVNHELRWRGIIKDDD